MIVIFSDEAEDDLDAISEYIAEDNPVRAVTFVNEIIDSCLKIADNPLAYQRLEGKFLPDGSEIRQMPYKKYNAFYTVNDEHVLILHVQRGTKRLPF